MGEAFIDIGAIELLKKIFPNERIVNISRMNYFYIKQKISNSSLEFKFLNMWDYIIGDDVKYIVLAGMFGSKIFIESLVKKNGNFIEYLLKKNIKIIFLGIGQQYYTEQETIDVINFLKSIKPILIVSRDDVVYNNLKNDFRIIKGIDCAYWCIDAYNPIIKCFKYDVVTYNRSLEPKELIVENEIVRAYHFQYDMKENNIKDNMLVSDSPYDYISLYANAEKVYTDLVHATIISLQYGKHVQFNRVDNRGLAIDALEGLKKDEQDMIYVEQELLEEQKKRIVKEITNELLKEL